MEEDAVTEVELLERMLKTMSVPTTAPAGNLFPPYPKATLNPTHGPTRKPTLKPTRKPTLKPTLKPTFKPTPKPTFKPTLKPTFKPTARPSNKPSESPKDCCNLPLGERRNQLLEIYSTVSRQADILTSGTPQNLAFEYVINDEVYCLCPNNASCELVQRYVMAVYYYSTKGDGWVNCGAKSLVCNSNETQNLFTGEEISGCFPEAKASWLSPVSSCTWCGNICEDVNNTCITQIELNSINQSGTLPFELQNLTFLYHLSNQVGSISSTIPPELGNIANLSYVDLDFQNLTGTIPDAFYSLPNMTNLDFNDNKLTGSIPNKICGLAKLEFLQVGNQDAGSNNFGGATIPDCIGSLQKLRVLDVQNLGLVGSLPKLTSPDLQFLEVSRNTLTGNLATTPWEDLSKLEYLVIYGNSMTGTIPASIGKIPGLKLGAFDSNDFTGSMPKEICDLTATSLENIQSDCNGATPEVTCTCCTFCGL
jgi:hypothetical protein